MIARALAWAIVRFASSVTLCKIERRIIEEILARQHYANNGAPGPRQWGSRIIGWARGEIVKHRIRSAEARLIRTVDSWRK